MTCPKTRSHSSGWTARVSSSVGSWRSLRSSPSVIVQASRTKRTGAIGSAQAAGRSARSGDVTVLTSFLAGLAQSRAGEMGEGVIEALARACLGGQFGRRSEGHELAEVHEPDTAAQFGRLVHAVSGQKDRGAGGLTKAPDVAPDSLPG